MAKATTSVKVETPAESNPAPPVFEKGSFKFILATAQAVPKEEARGPSRIGLPFKAMFSTMDPGTNNTFFVPTAFWVSERGTAPEKATFSFQRAKLREQFNTWRKEDEPNRGALGLTLINRPKGPDLAEFPMFEAYAGMEGVQAYLVED